MPIVLVNADDLGLHADIDRGIYDCIEAGVVQSASLSPNGSSLDWNKLDELQRAGVKLGLHVTLVGEPWGSDGRFIAGWKQLVRWLAIGGSRAREAVAAEIEWQLHECVDHGITLAHIDSHQHVHAFPGVWQPVLAAAIEHGIPRVRVPWSPSLSLIKKTPGGLGLQFFARRLANRVKASGGTFLPILGIAAAGHNTVEIYEREFVAVKEENVELCVHPGVNTPSLEEHYRAWKFDWTGERDALLSSKFKELIAKRGYAFEKIAK